MRAITDFDHDPTAPSSAERVMWIGLIVTSGTCLSLFFACVTPFAALATLAALHLGLRDRIATIGLVWLGNQAVGYGFLHYPWTLDSVGWGFAIGLSAAVAVLAAWSLSTARPAPLALSLPFVAAFTAFELALYLACGVLPASQGAFSARVIEHVFLTNAATLCALIVVHFVLVQSGRLLRGHGHEPPTLGAASL